MTNPREMTRYLIFLTLLGLGCLSIGLNRGFILDEYKTWMNCRLSMTDLVQDRFRSGHFPTYFALTKLWAGIFGISEPALRSFSVLLVFVTIVPFVLLAKALFSPGVARFAGILFITHQSILWIGQTARPYAGMLLFSVLMAYGLVRWWCDSRKIWLLAVTLSCAAGIAFMPLFALTPLAFFLALIPCRNRKAWAAILAMAIPCILLLAPMAMLGKSQSKYTTPEKLPGLNLSKGIDGLENIIFGDYGLWAHGFVGHVSLLILIVLIIAITQSRRPNPGAKGSC